MKKELILVKLGGSLITDKSIQERANIEIIKRLAKEIHSAKQKKEFNLIVGHGGGSFPHFPAKKYSTHLGFINKESGKGFCLVQDAASRLNRIVVKELIEAGENAFSLQPSAWCTTRKGKIEEYFIEPFSHAIEKKLVCVPFGDSVFDKEKGSHILSTEQILSFLAEKLKARRIIAVGRVKGVFTADPTKDKNAKLIEEINHKNFPKIKNMLSGSAGIDVTGGMLHKVEELLETANKNKIECSIISGLEQGNLERALLGERIGTTIKGRKK